GRQVEVAEQVLVAGRASADLPDDLASGGELGQGLALVVRDVEVAGTVDHQVARGEELALLAPKAAELADEPSLRAEDLDAGVSAVRDIDHSVAADSNLPVHVCRGCGVARDELELAGRGSGLPPSPRHLPGGRDHGHPLAA